MSNVPDDAVFTRRLMRQLLLVGPLGLSGALATELRRGEGLAYFYTVILAAGLVVGCVSRFYVRDADTRRLCGWFALVSGAAMIVPWFLNAL